MEISDNKKRSGKRRVVIAFASCVLGAGLILLASQMGSNPDDKPGAAEENAHAKAQKKKNQPTWNIALGNVVIVAPELGLSAKTLKGGRAEELKIATRLESQLQGLRDFYREESEKDPTLMGGMLLQVTVNPSGEVTHVKELVSRITDSEFKKTVLAEASKWTFPEIISDSTTITCPILFVREGMDITTITQWEKNLGQFSEKSAIAKASTPAVSQKHAQEGSKRNEPVGAVSQKHNQESSKRNEPVAKTAPVAAKPKIEPNVNVKPPPRTYQVKHPTTIRQEPDFGSASVGKFAAGTRVTVIAARGDWVEVRADEAGPTGFIRREFVAPSN
jgi:hypothetical protein